MEQRGQHFDGGCLSGAVWPQEGEDLALGHVEADIVDGGKRAKGLLQVLDPDHGLASLKNERGDEND
jgi:hypothetical protein